MQNWKGKNNPKYAHGKNRSPEHIAWKAMKQRCSNNPNYARFNDYYGRGIRVCKRWEKSFSNFLKDMGKKPSPKHSLDRINNDKGYSKRNCRWATNHEQAINTRKGYKITFNNMTKTLNGWSIFLGSSDKGLVSDRLKRGWSIEKALTTPLRKQNFKERSNQ